jgi:hypothetical protein
MRVLTGDHRFLEFHNEEMEGGPTNMIDVFGKVLEQGREQGIEQGREQGLAQGRAQGADENSQKIVRNLMKNHKALVKKRVDKRSPSMRPLIPHFELELGTLLSVLCCIM